jgi:hypothetical protein
MCEIVTSQLICPAILQNLVDSKTGIPLAGGVVTFYRQQDMSTLKNVYYQVGSAPPYTYVAAPNPMILSATGSTVDTNGNDVLLFYYPYLDQDFPVEMCDPSVIDTYYITVYDSMGTFQFDRKNFPFTAGSPTPSNSIATLENVVANNRFWRNLGQQQLGNGTTGYNAATLPVTYTHDEYNNTGTYYTVRLAPDQHDGFSMPDFRYIRNANSNITESIIFTKFPEQLPPPIIQGDIQPEYYINHNCSADTSGATLKIYQFPISLHIATLANQPFTFTIQGMATSGNATITVSIYQFCGTGSVSPGPIPVGAGTITFSNSWEKWSLVDIFPTNDGITLSGTNDDAFYLQIGMPVGTTGSPQPNAACNISFCLPSIYLIDALEAAPTNSFQTYDQIDAIIAAPRTGDVKISINDFYPFGWVPLTGGTLVNVNSGSVTVVAPTSNLGIAYQGTDGWPLYSMLWNRFVGFTNGSSNPLAQMFTAAGAAAAYGSNAWSDWGALKQLSLSPMIGRILLGTVPASALPILYSSTVTAAQLTTAFTATAINGGLLLTSTQPMAFGEIVQFANTGGGSALPSALSSATNYYAIPTSATTFYVATSLANAQSDIVVVGGSNGSGTINAITQSLVLTAANTPTSVNLFRGQVITFANTGGALPTGLVANTLYYAMPCYSATLGATTFCVATSFANAMSGNALVAYTDAGSGTTTVTISMPGASEGEYAHQSYASELGSHVHPAPGSAGTLQFSLSSGSGSGPAGSTGLTNPNTGPTGSGVPQNVTQPSVAMNFFIKL